MEWLSQNWIWIAVVAAVFFLMHSMHGRRMDRGNLGGPDGPRGREENAGPPLDPVSRHPVVSASAPISAVHAGRAYYFENRQNRDIFENDPDKYLAGVPAEGSLVESDQTHPQQRRHGC